ncbi:MAG: SH3 domain-containing protein, partial [Bacteroidales bacterium]|nr:SH3 domain-containing protein [Bacteroidales bacterium]
MDNNDFDLDSFPSKKNNKKKVLGGLILGAIPLLFIIYLVLGPLLHILSKDLSASEMYVISEWVNVRATPDIKSLKMGKIDYGTKLLVYEIKDDWAEVLIDGQKGYVANKFIADPATYYAIEGLFGDDNTAKTLTNSKYKLALIRYIESKDWITYIPEDIQMDIFGEVANKDVYQVYSEPKGSRFNYSAFADFDGDFRWDAAFVLKNRESDKKILVIFSFDKNDPLEMSKVIYEQELDQPWYFIRLAKKGYRYYLDD